MANETEEWDESESVFRAILADKIRYYPEQLDRIVDGRPVWEERDGE